MDFRHLVTCLLSLCLATSAFAQSGDDGETFRLKRVYRVNPYKNLDTAPLASDYSYSHAQIKLYPDSNQLLLGSTMFEEFDFDGSFCDPENQSTSSNCPDRSSRDSDFFVQKLPINLFRFPFARGPFDRLSGEFLNTQDGGFAPLTGAFYDQDLSFDPDGKTYFLPETRPGLMSNVFLDEGRSISNLGNSNVPETNSWVQVFQVLEDSSNTIVMGSDLRGVPFGDGTKTPTTNFQGQFPLILFRPGMPSNRYISLNPFPLASECLVEKLDYLSDDIEDCYSIGSWFPVYGQAVLDDDGEVTAVLGVFEVSGRVLEGASTENYLPLGQVTVLFTPSPTFDAPNVVFPRQAEAVPKGSSYFPPLNLPDRYAFLHEGGNKILLTANGSDGSVRRELHVYTCTGFSCNRVGDPEPQVPSNKQQIQVVNTLPDFSKVLALTSGDADLLELENDLLNREGFLHTNLDVELFSLSGDSYASEVVSVAPDAQGGEAMSACYDACRSEEIGGSIRQCLTIFCGVANAPSGMGEDGLLYSGGTLNTLGNDLIFTRAKVQILGELAGLISRPGPDNYGIAERENAEGMQETIISFPFHSPTVITTGPPLSLPDRALNLFVRNVERGETLLVTPPGDGVSIEGHKRIHFMQADLAADGESIAFLSNGEIGSNGFGRKQAFIARFAFRTEGDFSLKLRDVIDSIDREIEEDEEFIPVVTLPPADKPKARPTLEIPVTFIRRLFDIVQEENLVLRKRTQRKLEQIIGLLNLQSESVSVSAKKKKKKRRRADIKFRVRIERSVGTDESGNTIWKRVKNGTSRTKSLAKFKLPKLSAGTYRAFYKVVIKRAGRKKGKSTKFSGSSPDFEIVR